MQTPDNSKSTIFAKKRKEKVFIYQNDVQIKNYRTFEEFLRTECFDRVILFALDPSSLLIVKTNNLAIFSCK